MSKRPIGLATGVGTILLFLFLAALPALAVGGSVQQIVVHRTLNGSTGDVIVYNSGNWVNRWVYFDAATNVDVTIYAQGGSPDWYYQLRNDNGYNGTWNGSTTSRTFSPPSPIEDNYSAIVDGNWAGSTGEEFYLRECSTPATPGLILPENGTTIYNSTPTFDWTNDTSSTEYQIQVDNNAGFSSPEINVTGSSSDYTPHFSLSEGTYYWRIRGHNTDDPCNTWGAWSQTWTFTISSTPSIPSDVQASDGQYTDKVRITWTASPGATYYFVCKKPSISDSFICFDTSTNTAYDDFNVIPDDPYYYAVQACAIECSGYSNLNPGYASNWQQQGLYGASPGDSEGVLISNIGDVYFCPQDGTYGLYQWNELQSSWEAMESTVGGCRDTTFDNINNRLYWLGGGAGIYNHAFRSDDGGLSWTAILTPAFPEMALVVEVAQVSTGTVYIGVNRNNCSANKVYRSTTAGAAWQPAQLAPDGVNFTAAIDACLQDIAVDPANPNNVYLAAVNSGNDYGIYRSTDGGLTFRRVVTPTQDDADRVVVNANGTVFAQFDGDKLWRSYNQGDAWTNVNAPSGGLGFHPTFSDTIFVHGHRSDNEGDSWNVWAGDQFDPPAIDPNNLNHWYAFALPGVWRSTDGGSTLNPINAGLSEVNVNRIAVAQNVTGTYWVAGRDIGVGYTTDDGDNWTFPVMFGGEAIQAADVAIDPNNANRIYIASGEDVFITTNGGASLNAVQAIPSGQGQVTALAIDPQQPLTLYLAAITEDFDGGAVYKSTNGGSSWSVTSLQNVPVASLLVVSHSLTTTLYAGAFLTDTNSTGGLYRSVDGGANWTHLGLNNSEIVHIEADPRNPALLYAGAGAHDHHHAYPTNRGVYKSANRGQTWAKVLNDRVFDIAIDAANPDTVYAIIWMNVWRSTDAGTTWQLYYQHDWQNPTQGRPWALNIAQFPQVGGSSLQAGGAIQAQNAAQSVLYLGSSRGLYSQTVGNTNTFLPIILKQTP